MEFYVFKRNIKKWSTFKKLLCEDKKLRWSYDLGENHLIASILASAKYNCSAEEGGVLIEKMNRHFCKDCVRGCCSRLAEFFVYKIFNL